MEKTPNNNASYKVAKNDSMIPQRLGGMGMLNLKTFWQSLHLTWLRKLISSKATWVKILEINLNKLRYQMNDILYASSNQLRLIGNNLQNTHWKEIFFSAAKTLDLDPYKKTSTYNYNPSAITKYLSTGTIQSHMQPSDTTPQNN